MDAATLIMIMKLTDGREAEKPLREFPTVQSCEAYRGRVQVRLNPDLPPVRYECRRHYRMAG
jgi:hypothetical protein